MVEVNNNNTMEVFFNLTNTGKTHEAKVASLCPNKFKFVIACAAKESNNFQMAFLKFRKYHWNSKVIPITHFANYNEKTGNWAVQPEKCPLLLGYSSSYIKTDRYRQFLNDVSLYLYSTF